MKKITAIKLPKIEVLKVSAAKGMPEVGASESPKNSCTNVKPK